jgi:hypothetical protein
MEGSVKRLHLDYSDGRRFYTLCECDGPCIGWNALFNWREMLLLRIADFFDCRAQRLLRRKDEAIYEAYEAKSARQTTGSDPIKY